MYDGNKKLIGKFLVILFIVSFIVNGILLLLEPYSIEYAITGKMTVGYLIYALLGVLFSTPAPVISLFILLKTEEKITLKEGKIPQNNYEVIVNIKNKYEMPIGKEINYKINNTKLKVVGYYFSEDNYDFLLANKDTIVYSYIENSNNFLISLYILISVSLSFITNSNLKYENEFTDFSDENNYDRFPTSVWRQLSILS